MGNSSVVLAYLKQKSRILKHLAIPVVTIQQSHLMLMITNRIFKKNVDEIHAKIRETERQKEKLPAHYKEQILTFPINLQHLENINRDINNILVFKLLLNEKS